VTGDTVDAMLENGASGAVVSVLAPICVDKFQRQADVTTNLIELKKINSWQPVSKMAAGQRRRSDCARTPLARACVALLGNLNL
jgi:ABC-type uncharacterized transport system ATPase subunit